MDNVETERGTSGGTELIQSSGYALTDSENADKVGLSFNGLITEIIAYASERLTAKADYYTKQPLTLE